MVFQLFPDFFEKPAKMGFSDQEKNEVIELFLRQHFITNIPWILFSLLALVFPAVALYLDVFLKFNLFLNVPTPVLTGSLIVYYLLLLAYGLEKFLHWYFNIYIVTNLHIVDINFISLLRREVTEVQLDDIQSVTYKITGVIRPLFNFGTVLIKTANENDNLDFKDVPRPSEVSDRIQDLQENYVRSVRNGGV